jgi:hypothetical protein
MTQRGFIAELIDTASPSLFRPLFAREAARITRFSLQGELS